VRVDEHTVELDGNLVFYRRATADTPEPVYLHGIPTSSDVWEPLLERTAGLAPDLIGFGRSSKAGHLDYTLAGLAGYVAQLLAHENIERPILVGHDWGALVALELARRIPTHGLFLIAPPQLESRLAKAWRTPVLGELLMGAISKRMLARHLRGASAEPQTAWPQPRIDQLWDQFDQGTQRAILRLHRATGPHYLETAHEATVIHGERDPWRAQSQEATRTLEIPGAGHWPWLDQPDAVAAILAP
jgi:pimeloyl-ACP methyl ester carboxylesterase